MTHLFYMTPNQMNALISMEMSMRTIFSAKKKVSSTPESVGIGGTGDITPQAALDALGGIPLDTLDQAYGVAVLGSDLLIKPVNIPDLNANIAPTVHLPSVIETTQKVECHITNYSNQRAYALTNVIGGSASLYTYDDFIADMESTDYYNYPIDNTSESSEYDTFHKPGTIVFTASNIAGTGGFTLNGKVYSFDIVEHLPAPVSITWPTVNYVNTVDHILVESDNVYDAIYNAPTDIIFELAEDINFTLNLRTQTVFVNGYANASQFNFTDLLENKLYYVRARAKYSYGGNTNILSAWSTVISFATVAKFPLSEVQLLHNNYLQAWQEFGRYISMSDDSNYLAIAAPSEYHSGDENHGSQNGSISIFKKAVANDIPNQVYQNLYYLNNKIYSNDGANIGKVAFSDDGRYLFVVNDFVEYIKVFKSTTTPITWDNPVEVLNITPDESITNSNRFGYAFSISNTVNGFIYLVARDLNHNVSVYKFNTTTETIDSSVVLIYPTIATNLDPNFGISIKINGNGDRIIVGASLGEAVYDGDGYPITCGVACLYQRTGDTWAFAHRFDPIDVNTPQQSFGEIVSINHAGTEVIIASNYRTQLHVFREINSLWTRSAVHSVQTLSEDSNFDSVTYITISGDDTSLFLTLFDSIFGTSLVSRFTKDINNNYVKKYYLNTSSTHSQNYFGKEIAVSNNGNIVAISDYENDYNQSLSAPGAVYIFE